MTSVRFRGRTLAGLVCLIWAVSLVGLANPAFVDSLALYPRRPHGLSGILSSPFVHGSWEHLWVNSGALLFLGGLLVARGGPYFLRVTVAIAILGGIGLWCLGREGGHIGASGLVFGMFGFLIARAIFERSTQSTLVALIVILFHGSMIFGVLPGDADISWEGHLFGLIAGGAVAYAMNAHSVRGEDVRERLDITLEQAFGGARCRLQAVVPATTSVRPTRRQDLRVRVPAGTRDGETLRLRGRGGECAGAGPPGDLLLSVHVAPNPVFSVDGRDITSSLRVAPEDAAEGARVRTRTLGGDVKLRVPGGSTTGTRLRLRGRGLPGKPPGDQIVTIVVDRFQRRA